MGALLRSYDPSGKDGKKNGEKKETKQKKKIDRRKIDVVVAGTLYSRLNNDDVCGWTAAAM